MMMNHKRLFLGFAFLAFILVFNNANSQSANFAIKVGCRLCEKSPDLLRFIKVRGYTTILSADSCTTARRIIVRNDSIDFGIRVDAISSELRSILNALDSTCKDKEQVIIPKNNYEGPGVGNVLTPITGATNTIWDDFSIRFANAGVKRYIVSPDYYVNPYFQAFGGDELGLPFAYGAGVGLTAAFGTPYSGVMETDFVKGGIHILIFEFAVTSRVKEFVSKYSANNKLVDTRSTWIGNWNNLYTPHLGFEVSGDLPFLKLSYFSTIDTLDETDPPVKVLNEVTGEPMKNNIARGEYFGFELRTPNLIVCNSTRAKFYFAKKFGEYHLGYVGREMKIGDFIFDFRMNATFPGKRDFQLLTELYFDSQWAGFANKAFGFGPSFRFGKTPGDNFGVITAFLNMRLKIGDFFDENLY